MSGKVVTISAAFADHDGAFGSYSIAIGPFEVSASRDAVMVHRAHCVSDADIDGLLTAIERARRLWRELAAKNQE
jgi:hypothetical protein